MMLKTEGGGGGGGGGVIVLKVQNMSENILAINISMLAKYACYPI